MSRFMLLRSKKWLRRLAIMLVPLVGVGAWLLSEELLTRRAFQRGVDALAAGDNSAARTHFDRCLSWWPHVPEVPFRAAQATRRAGDLVTAAGLLSDAAAIGWKMEDIERERALIAVKAGVPFPRVEPALRAALDGESSSVPEVYAALVTNYLGQFRVVEAEALCEKWVDRWPDDVAAWRLRSDALERMNRTGAARLAFTRWAQLAPDDRQARLGLVRALLAAQAPAAVIDEELERLQAARSEDPEVLRYLAQSQLAGGNATAAAATLDRAIVTGKADSLTYMYRAKVDLDRGQPVAALPFARKAVTLDSSGVETLFTLLSCLQQTGPASEAADVEARWRQANADLGRVNELGRKISANPFNPDLRREMGELYLRHGHDTEGLRWLESALAIQADHVATHKVFADYYTRTGRASQAAAHRSQMK